MNMKDNRNSIFYSGWMKALGVVALCIFGALLMWYGSSFVFREYYFSKETAATYEETENCQNMMRQDAVNVIGSIENYGEYSVTLADYGNLKVGVRNITDDKQILEVAEDRYSCEEQFYIVADEYGNVYDVSSVSDADKTDTVYEVDTRLLEGLPYEDEYHNMNEIYTFSRQSSGASIGLCIGLFLAFIVVLIYEFTVTGHVVGKEGITLYFEDRIPFDLLTGIYFIVALIFAMLTGTAMPSFSLHVSLAWMIGILLGLSLLFYAWLMSATRRIKAGGWYRNTLVYKVCYAIIGVFHMIPAVPLVTVVAAIWLFMQWVICSVASYYTGFATIVALLSPVLAAVVIYCVWFFEKMQKASLSLAGGDLSFTFSEKDKKWLIGPFRKYAENYEKISEGMQRAIDERMKSERLKAELITNVSHDIKTPLTSIINYVDLLQKEHTEEEGKEYIAVLDRQSQRLKKLTEDVVEASKASTGNITVNLMKTDVKEIIDQALAEYEDKIVDAGLTVVPTVKDIPLYAYSDGRLLWRVLRNLLSNCAKYGLSGTRLYIDAYAKDDEHVQIVIKNTSREELNISADELMERFVRGDASRHTEGSGLGLNIARSLMELMGGVFDIEIDGDLFKAMIILPKNRQ